MMGSRRSGIDVIGEGNDSQGSEFLIDLALEDDNRPIWVAAWGGANTLAQALWKLKQTYSQEDFETIAHQFRLFTITDQDIQIAKRQSYDQSSHSWMRRELNNHLLFIWDENTWQLQCELGKQNWETHRNLIQGHGALGSIYPDYKYGVEGDTPSFLHVMPNGLSDPTDPQQANWGGYHTYGISPDGKTNAWSSWSEPQKSMTTTYKRRFYQDELNDFCARMQWAQEGTGNTNPVVKVNGKHSSRPLIIKAKAGEEIRLNAKKTRDKDGDNLTYNWWQQPETGGETTLVDINGNNTPVATFVIPNDARGTTIHIICEVHDDGPFHLVGYQRVIIRVI